MNGNFSISILKIYFICNFNNMTAIFQIIVEALQKKIK